jgi:hypothetical protein
VVTQRDHDELVAQVAVLQDIVDVLRLANERQYDTPPPKVWIALKAAVPPGVSYETARSWCELGYVTSRKQGGRWLVDRDSLCAVTASRMSGAA